MLHILVMTREEKTVGGGSLLRCRVNVEEELRWSITILVGNNFREPASKRAIASCNTICFTGTVCKQRGARPEAEAVSQAVYLFP
jgi:hypothetical protein